MYPSSSRRRKHTITGESTSHQCLTLLKLSKQEKYEVILMFDEIIVNQLTTTLHEPSFHEYYKWYVYLPDIL